MRPGTAAVYLIFLSASAGAQSIPDAVPYPPPGRLVDVGGWRLHLNCTGQATMSQPTAILEAGIGDFSTDVLTRGKSEEWVPMARRSKRSTDGIIRPSRRSHATGS